VRSGPGNRFLAFAVATAGVFLASPAAAWAHSLNVDDDPNRPLWKYLWFGFLHMATGWDHLLFILGVVLIAGSVSTAAKLISLFVAGHSITLLVATLAGWQLDPTLVDVVIALSVVYVGVRGVAGGPANLRIDGAIVFAFGLVHGLGLSTRFQDLGLPDDGLAVRMLLFNVGVEIGQLTAIAIIVGLGALVVRQIAGLRARGAVQRAVSGVLIPAGLIAAVVLGISGTGSEDEAYGAGCSELSATPPSAQGVGGDHPANSFYGPDEAIPGADFAHVLADGFVVITYREDLRARELASLRRWIASERAPVVAGALDGQTEAVRALTARRELRCRQFHLGSLATFRDDWLDELRG
jgi:hydrogenase/urease accessory protein HupE